MIRQPLKITLLEDCVFSARTATTGGHQALDRIPGQALLGAAAAESYNKFPADQAFDIFHSGGFRFGDGLPGRGHSFALPMPLSWHHYKGEEPRQEGGHRLAPDRVLNLLHARPAPERQPVQMRKGYVLEDGSWIRPRTSLRLKTAIAPDTGRAAEAQLFGYASLTKGQQFVAELQCDDKLEEYMSTVVESLAGECLLGRSRSAEYGRVRIEPIDAIGSPQPAESATELHLLLMSDLALVDENGQPALEPKPGLLGLGDGEIDWQRTWLRTRRYSVWNQYRNGYDRERVVINAGSVVTLKLDRAPDEAALVALQAGVGCHRECGLGRILVNPDLLASGRPAFKDAIAIPASDAEARPDDPLIDWLQGQMGLQDIEVDRKAEEITARFRTNVERARHIAGVSPALPFGPSRSQWGGVLEVARTTRADGMIARLFEGDDACVKSSAEGWQEEVRDGDGQWWSLAQVLKDLLDRKKIEKDIPDLTDSDYVSVVRRLARRMLSEPSSHSKESKKRETS